MPMSPSALEACHKDLFSDIADLQSRYSKDTVDKIIRVRDMYMTFLKTPSMTDSSLIKQFTARYKVSRPTAYSDLAVVKALLPMLGKEAREFHRWRAKEMLLETYRVAAAKMDPRTMERVASSYARVFDVSREDDFIVPVDKIVPQPFVPTDDPSVIGLKPLPDRDNKIRALIQELSSSSPDILEIAAEDPDISISWPEHTDGS